MLKSFLTHHARSHGPFSRQLVTAAQLYLNAYCRVDDYNIDTNGERALLSALGRFAPRVFFDVGANKGDWTGAVIDAHPGADIHAFELSPVTASALQARYASFPNIRINAFGLSEANQQVTITHVDADPTLTGLYKDVSGLGGRSMSSEVKTGASYLLEGSIPTVDLLKIDTEGHDLDVLRGFAPLLDRCTVIQFEYNELSWARGAFLPAFENALPGFKLGRLTAAGVIWRTGLISNARAMAGNIVAVREDRADMIRAFERFA